MSQENSFGVGMEVGAQVESSEEKAIVDSMREGDSSISDSFKWVEWRVQNVRYRCSSFQLLSYIF